MQSITADVLLHPAKKISGVIKKTKNKVHEFEGVLEKLTEKTKKLSVEKSEVKEQKNQPEIVSVNEMETEKNKSGENMKAAKEIKEAEDKTDEVKLFCDKIYEFILNFISINDTNNTLAKVEFLNSKEGVNSTEKTISDIRSVLNLLTALKNKGSEDFRQKILSLLEGYSREHEIFTTEENKADLYLLISRAISVIKNENTVEPDITVKTPELMNLNLKPLKNQAEMEDKKAEINIVTQKKMSGTKKTDTLIKENTKGILPGNKGILADAGGEREITANSDIVKKPRTYLKNNLRESNGNENSIKKESENKSGEIKTILNPMADNTSDSPEQIKSVNTGLFSNSDIENSQKADANPVISKPEIIRQPVTMTERIISQVVGKARFIIDGQKSEMIINLKPDSLGRLSMKVVTENKLVTAEIVVENYQVKQVIESGMHQLKQSLEEQGMFIQDLSVSVRQDGGKEPESGMSGEKKDDAYINGAETPDKSSEYSNKLMDISLINPYIFNESKINLTA